MPGLLGKSIFISLSFLCILTLPCEAQIQYKRKGKSIDAALIDTVRRRMNITDSIEIIDKKYYNNGDTLDGILFIDYNKRSNLHPSESINNEDKKLIAYTGAYDDHNSLDTFPQDRDSLNIIKKKIPAFIIGDWIPIFKYKGKFYLYNCEFEGGIGFTDSTVKFCFMDGITEFKIRDMRQKKNSIVLHTIDSDIEVSLEDKPNKIFKINNRGICGYYTPISNARSFYIISCWCTEEDAIILKYEHPKCK